MSIQGITAGSMAATAATPTHRRGGKIGQDFDSLADALNSGDLNSAKTAFASLQADLKKRAGLGNDGDADNQATKATSAATKSSNNPIDILAKALESGDIKTAQKAFADFLKSAGKNHHHKDGSKQGVADAGGASSVTTSFEMLVSSTTASSYGQSGASSSQSSPDPFGFSGRSLDLQA